MKNRIFVTLLLLALGMGFQGCKRQTTSSVNIEQAGHPVASRILAPGMGTIGVIDNGKVYVYFLNEKQEWILDKLSQFEIPEDNQGLIATGMGTIGVVTGREIRFHRLDATNNWISDPRYTFRLPRKYDRIIGIRMPWEMGIIGIENNKMLDFYYFDDAGEWVRDETASFQIPKGVDHCFSLGDMTVAIADAVHLLTVFYYIPVRLFL